MDQTLWATVDQYIEGMLVGEDSALAAARENSLAAGLPAIQVSAAQGKFLHLLVVATGARRILEIGTLGGYSAIWMGRALPADGRLITLEVNPQRAELARANLARAGVAGVVEVRVGKALEALPKIEAEAAGGAGPFDLLFIDADKENNADYFAWAMKLSRRGSMILVDNVVRKGAVADAANHDADVQGTRRLYDAVKAEKRVQATAMQTVGSKGYDGLMMAVVK